VREREREIDKGRVRNKRKTSKNENPSNGPYCEYLI